jgi:hypothetical protein
MKYGSDLASIDLQAAAERARMTIRLPNNPSLRVISFESEARPTAGALRQREISQQSHPNAAKLTQLQRT